MNPIARPRLFSSTHLLVSLSDAGGLISCSHCLCALVFGYWLQEDTFQWQYLEERYPAALHGVETGLPRLPWEHQGLPKLFLWINSHHQRGS